MRAVYPRWEFSLLSGLAWTWVTNIVTVPPIYYTFYVTGRLMLGHGGPLQGYDSFRTTLAETLSRDADWLEALWTYSTGLFESFGVPMFVGCIPWALIGSWVAYRWSLRFIVRLRHSRDRRRRRRAARAADQL